MRRAWLAGTGLLVLCAGPAWAQAVRIEGTVHDALGRPLAGAQVILETSDGRTLATAAADSSGHYSFAAVAAGNYAVLADRPSYQTGTAIVTLGPSGTASADLVLQSSQALDLAVTAKKLDQARNNLSPETGSSTYEVDAQAVQDLPQGTDTPFSQVLLQAPGFAQDSAASGLMHVRGEHADVQYRINGVLLPEGISGFGQTLDSDIIGNMQILDGTLPAQYGYRTAAVVDIQTKDGAFDQGGTVGLSGGSHDTLSPSIDYGGTSGPLSYFVSGDLYRSGYGIEGPTPAANPQHDETSQGKDFGYFSYLLNDTNRLNLVMGDSVSRFDVPDNPDQSPGYFLSGAATEPSGDLTESQLEESHFLTLALQGTHGPFDYQIAPYARYTLLHYYPDPVGDLEYDGVASNVLESDFANGVQADGSWHVNDAHTLRAGMMAQDEYAVNDNTSAVFSTDSGCDATSTACPSETLTDDHDKIGTFGGVYLQDEWKIARPLTLNYGLRFDAMDAYVQASQLSPRIGLVYNVTPSTTFHAGYARQFTPPPLELVQPSSVATFANTTEEPTVTTDDPVKPERTHSFDIGITNQTTEQLKLGLDAYYKLSQDLLDEGQFGQALVLTPFNYAKGRVYGSEFTASYNQGPLTAYFNLSLSRAMGESVASSQESFSSDPTELAGTMGHWIYLDHDQTYTTSAGIAYKLARDTTLTLDDIDGSGLRDGFDNTDHLPNYNQVNAGVIQHIDAFDDKGADLRLSVINLLNSHYELRDGSGIGVGAPQWGPSLGLYAGLSRKF